MGSLGEAQRNPGEAPETTSRIALRSIRATDLDALAPPASSRFTRSAVLAAVLLLIVTILLVQHLSQSSLSPQSSAL